MLTSLLCWGHEETHCNKAAEEKGNEATRKDSLSTYHSNVWSTKKYPRQFNELIDARIGLRSPGKKRRERESKKEQCVGSGIDAS